MLSFQPKVAIVYFSHLFLEHLMRLSMEELVEFLQETLAKDFFFEDDFVIEQLQISMAELKRAKLDLPEPGKEIARGFMYNLQLRLGATVQLTWPIAV